MAISIFENAIALDPQHPEALFWSGMGAFNRGDTDAAIQRWERLLEKDLPPQVRPQIEQQLAVWRGEPPPATPAAAGGSAIRAMVSVSDAAQSALPAQATVFVIARDPAQPSPPIAVTRRQLTELPAVIELSDRDSMIPGRALSNFAEVELLARVSISGSPAAQAGDWFGSQIVRPAESGDVEISIGEQVP